MVVHAIPDLVLNAAVASLRSSPLLRTRICELNLQGAEHAEAICGRWQQKRQEQTQSGGLEYIGISFANASSTGGRATPNVSGCSHYEVLIPGPAVYSARVVLDKQAVNGSAILASCHVVILNMDASTAEARQTLITEVATGSQTALQLASSAATVIMVGRGCDGEFGSVDDLGHVESWQNGRMVWSEGDTYVNAWNFVQTEQCWVRHAWLELRMRGDVLSPLANQLNECARITGRLWCVGTLAPASESICRPLLPAMFQDDELESTPWRRVGSHDLCRAIVKTVRFPHSPPPDWDLTAVGKKRALDLRGTAAVVRSTYLDYTLLPCDDEPVPLARRHLNRRSGRHPLCLLFKSGAAGKWLAGLTSRDGGRSFKGHASLVLPGGTKAPSPNGRPYHGLRQRIVHNAAITSVRGDGGRHHHVLVGGRFRSPIDIEMGIWMATGHDWRWSSVPSVPPAYAGAGTFNISSVPAPDNWRDFHLLFNGTHAGCVDRRRDAVWLRTSNVSQGGWLSSPCSFDGRLSLVHHRAAWLLYSRADLGAGMEWYQMTRSYDGRDWMPFELLTIDDFAPSSGSTNFFAVQENPVHNGSLIALVPIVHRSRACIGFTISLDGLAWSRMVPLMHCVAYGQRAAHSPVAGGLVRVGRGRVACFIHENVPGIHDYDDDQPHERMPFALANHLKLESSRAHSATVRASGKMPTTRKMSRVMRVEFACERLASWTKHGLKALSNGEAYDKSAYYSCTPDAACEKDLKLMNRTTNIGVSTEEFAPVAQLRFLYGTRYS